jgi:YggT family protein
MSANSYLITLVVTLANVLTFLILIQAVLSFVLSPFHPVRMTLSRFLEPIYAPIRRILPPVGAFDFTPLVVLLIVNVLERLIISMLQ